MRVLLDTHILLWAAVQSYRLPAEARALLEQPSTDVIYSPVSLWEIAVKRALNRPDFSVDPRILRRELLDHGYAELPVTSEHALAVEGMPTLHKDPFDRLLIAQSIAEGVILLTADTIVARYPGPIRKV